MPSFDVVNRLDYQEIGNAIGNTKREIAILDCFNNRICSSE